MAAKEKAKFKNNLILSREENIKIWHHGEIYDPAQSDEIAYLEGKKTVFFCQHLWTHTSLPPL